MIVKVKANPSRIHNGEYIVTDSHVIHVDDCEQIHADVGGRTKIYVRVPVPRTGESCCYDCHLSSRHKGSVKGICANVAGCGTYQVHYIDADDMLEEI